ncbi:MAG: extracellular solute-binding protein [Clostridiales bacterium]|nr:extracellular solute-binding protein [Clostridiales bacterium]
MYSKRTALTAAFLCLAFCVSACKREENVFPELPGEPEASAPALETETSEGETKSIRTLSVALPYSDDTVRYLSAMFYMKRSGTWDDMYTGADIDLASLDGISTDFVITNSEVPSKGADLVTIKSWDDNGSLPDVFLAQDCSSVYSGGYCTALNDYISDSEYIDMSQIYMDALLYASDGGVFYGIPHYSSAVILLGNSDYIPDSGILSSKFTNAELKTYLEDIASENEEGSVVPFASAYKLAPYIAGSFDGDKAYSFMMYEEYENDSAAASEVLISDIDYIGSLYESGLASNTDASGADPVYARNAAVWLESSDNIGIWSEYFPGKLYILRLPCADTANPGVPYLEPYSLCVAEDCTDKEFAADFAEFITYDVDAQLLIYRTEDMSGYLPVIRDQGLWDEVCEDEVFGTEAYIYSQIMDNAVYCPAGYDNPLYMNSAEYLAEFFTLDADFDPEACYGGN